MKQQIDFNELIEELRITNGISITELCEDIISERTYYRYINKEQAIRHDIFFKLIHKLNINFTQLFCYTFTFCDNGDPGINRFIYRIHTESFADIVPIYEKVAKFKSDNVYEQAIIDAYIFKYKYMTKVISVDSYRKGLETLIKRFDKDKTDNVFIKLILALYLDLEPKQTLFDANLLAGKVLETDFCMGFFFHLLTVDNLLMTYLHHKAYKFSYFVELYKCYENLTNYMEIKYFYLNLCLYTAYILKKQNKPIGMKKMLFKYYVGMMVLADGCKIKEHVNLLQDIFGIDVDDLTEERLAHALTAKNLCIKEI